MINPAKIEDIARQIGSNMPKGMRDMAENFKVRLKQYCKINSQRLTS